MFEFWSDMSEPILIVCVQRDQHVPAVFIAMTCPRCGTFKKSGRVSCCAPGLSVAEVLATKTLVTGLKTFKRKFKVYEMYIQNSAD